MKGVCKEEIGFEIGFTKLAKDLNPPMPASRKCLECTGDLSKIYPGKPNQILPGFRSDTNITNMTVTKSSLDLFKGIWSGKHDSDLKKYTGVPANVRFQFWECGLLVTALGKGSSYRDETIET